MPPKSSRPIKSNANKLDKTKKNLIGAKGQIFNNLDIINDFLKASVSSNINVKVGHIIASLIEHTTNSLLHDGEENLAISHHNEQKKNSDITIYRTTAYMGKSHNSKINAYLRGPIYEPLEKCLVDSQQDWLSSIDRKHLRATSGINQRGIVFLEQDTFLTINDALELSNINDHSEKIKKQFDKIEKKFKDAKKTLNKENVDTVEKFLKNLKAREKEKGIIHFYSALLEMRTEIRIMNKMPVYDCNIAVHLIKLRNFEGSVLTVKDVFNDICYSSEQDLNKSHLYLDRIEPIDIFEKIDVKEEELKFKRQLNTALKINPTNIESFKQNCIVAKTWRRRLKTGDHWYIKINEKFKNGIYLNRLEELKAKNIAKDTPINYFLMIEFYGDNRASVLRKKDDISISSIYSPCLLNFEYKMSVKHLGDAAKNPDEFLIYKNVRNIREFEDDTIGMEFYPKRETKFNVNFENIKIGNEKGKKDAEFKLELNSSILESQQLSQMDKLIERITSIDPELANNLSEDDAPFINNESEENDEDHENLRKSKPDTNDEV